MKKVLVHAEGFGYQYVKLKLVSPILKVGQYIYVNAPLAQRPQVLLLAFMQNVLALLFRMILLICMMSPLVLFIIQSFDPTSYFFIVQYFQSYSLVMLSALLLCTIRVASQGSTSLSGVSKIALFIMTTPSFLQGVKRALLFQNHQLDKPGGIINDLRIGNLVIIAANASVLFFLRDSRDALTQWAILNICILIFSYLWLFITYRSRVLRLNRLAAMLCYAIVMALFCFSVIHFFTIHPSLKVQVAVYDVTGIVNLLYFILITILIIAVPVYHVCTIYSMRSFRNE